MSNFVGLISYVEREAGQLKYTLTAIFIASLFKDLEEMKWVVYGLSLFASACLLITGLLLTNKKKEDDK